MNEDFDITTFKSVELSDRMVLNGFLSNMEPEFCDYNFANLFCWGDIFQIRWKILSKRLWIYNGLEDRLGFPLGRKITPDELIYISNHLQLAGLTGDFIQVPVEYVDQHPLLQRFFIAKLDKPNADYVYSVSKLVELRGRKLHSKKNLINQFLRNHPHYRCLKMQPQHFSSCLDLANTWREAKNFDKEVFKQEKHTLEKVFSNFTYLQQQGAVIFTDDQLVAFSVYDRLNSTTAVVHYEKYNPRIKGTAQIVNWETANMLQKEGYTSVNREQDLGQPNLRRAKQSYCPDTIKYSYLLLTQDGNVDMER